LDRKASGRERQIGKNWIALDVDVADLTREVQEFYGFKSEGPRSVEIPKQKWIRRALEALVVFGYAKHQSGTMYQVRYRRLRSKDMLTTFGELCFKHRKPLLEIAEGRLESQALLPLTVTDTATKP
jgi:hypothetical protein